MTQDRSLSTSEALGATAEVLDHVNEHLLRWESKLRRIDPESFCCALKDRISRDAEVDHFVIFEAHNGERRLIEVKIEGELAHERLLAHAPRTVRVEALRRLPKAFEGVVIRRKHGTG